MAAVVVVAVAVVVVVVVVDIVVVVETSVCPRLSPQRCFEVSARVN